MAKFKVGDRVRLKKDGPLFSEERDDMGESIIIKINEVDFGGHKWYNVEWHNRGFRCVDLELAESVVDESPTESVEKECPSIIKLEQKFTLQIKEHVIELDKAEVTALREQLLEI